MSKGVEWAGVGNLIKAIDNFEEDYLKAVKRVIATTAVTIQTQAKALAPVDEGNLRKSIEIEYSNNGFTAHIVVGAEYGIYVEYGTGIYSTEGTGRKTPWVYWSSKINRWVYTRGIVAQPYWTPAVESGSQFFEREMNKLG
ncbi:HK97 gp10 family phage protein [Salimicrobium jeotgali]|uniref:HK97 gp10 family phage protein n=1 Tax=Salimicrobium jeotgali TaxID=1230341 RepID=UPI000C8148F7|nr:HK97 gp10 family phage protein [Salimicrobium jeotgali]